MSAFCVLFIPSIVYYWQCVPLPGAMSSWVSSLGNNGVVCKKEQNLTVEASHISFLILTRNIRTKGKKSPPNWANGIGADLADFARYRVSHWDEMKTRKMSAQGRRIIPKPGEEGHKVLLWCALRLILWCALYPKLGRYGKRGIWFALFFFMLGFGDNIYNRGYDTYGACILKSLQ